MRLSATAIAWLPMLPSTRRRLRRELNDRKYHEALAEARSEGNQDAVQHLQWQRHQDEIDEYEWQEILFTRKLLSRARKLRVERPPRPQAGDMASEYWSVSQVHGEWYLTAAGVVKLRDAIRAEERWLREQRAHYLAWVTPIIGLIGALTGLLAVVMRGK
jgi:hypothetical protein